MTRCSASWSFSILLLKPVRCVEEPLVLRSIFNEETSSSDRRGVTESVHAASAVVYKLAAASYFWHNFSSKVADLVKLHTVTENHSDGSFPSWLCGNSIPAAFQGCPAALKQTRANKHRRNCAAHK